MGQFDCGYGAWIPGPVLDDAGLRPRSLILYARIARRANRVGFCYATNATLVEDMTTTDTDGSVRVLSERTIQAMLAELQDRGHIRMDTGPIPSQKTGAVRTGRRIFIGRALMDENSIPDWGEENFTHENFFTQGVKKTSPPIKCIKEEKKKNTPFPPISICKRIKEYAAGDRELYDAIFGLVMNRREALGPKKAVKTLRTMDGILRDLDAHSYGDRQVKLIMLAKAVKNNWLTVYALKPDEMPKASSGRMEEQEGVEYF